MPYALLTCSHELEQTTDMDQLFAAFHEIIYETIGAPIHLCKSYLCPSPTHFQVGAGRKEDAFIRVELCLLAGRSPEAKAALGQALLNCLKQYFESAITSFSVQMSVKLTEMAHADYFAFDSATAKKPA